MKKYRREKWILKAKKRDCCKTFCLVSALMENQIKKAWKAPSMATPLFRAGDEASMIRNPVWKTALGELSPSRPVTSYRRGPSFRRMDFRGPPPALKGGVTANVALRAGRGFATASFWEIGRVKGFESLIWECFAFSTRQENKWMDLSEKTPRYLYLKGTVKGTV